jgi:hypothetical protein
MSTKKPCIRGLREFKRGCPEGGECPAWITRTVPTRTNPAVGETISQCLDIWMLTVNWDTNKLLEGVAQAIESFRNNMTEVTEGGSFPKTSRGMAHLINMVEKQMENRDLIAAHEMRKKLIDS